MSANTQKAKFKPMNAGQAFTQFKSQRRKPKPFPIKHGTMTLLKSNDLVTNVITQSTGDDPYAASSKKNMPEQAKLKLKWKTIQYLLENKKPQIEVLTNNLKELINEVKDEKKRMAEEEQNGLSKRGRSKRTRALNAKTMNIFSNVGSKEADDKQATGLNREEFAKLLEMIGLGTDKNLIDKLFWIFDDDGNGEVDHKELAVGLEMLKENTFADKLDRFFEICDEDNSGTIDKKEFYNLLKLSIVDYEDRSSLRNFVNEIFSMVDKDDNGEITKQEMRFACSKND